MNEEAVLIDLIKKRRSVRAYTHEPVNKKDISDILSAAAYTPSAFPCSAVESVRFNGACERGGNE